MTTGLRDVNRLVPMFKALFVAFLVAVAAEAHETKVRAPFPAVCPAGSPLRAWVVNGSTATDCVSGGGTYQVDCCCTNNAWAACASATGGGGYTTVQEEGSSLTQRDTVNFVGTSITCADSGGKTVCTLTDATGTSITLDLGDDGGNDSTALAEIATTNDNGGAFTEPSADKMLVDVAKLRPASADNPLESAATWACEFDGSICSGSLVGTGTTSNPVAGTIDLLASVTPDPVYSFSFLPGKLCIQSDESTNQTIDLYWSRTPATNATFLVKVDFQNRDLSTTEGTVELGLKYTSDANESVWSNVYGGGSGFLPRIYVENNGAFTIVNGIARSEKTLDPTTSWMVVWKVGNVYHGGWMSHADGLLTPLSSVTKTTVTTFDELHLRFLTANDSPSIVWCVDYVRYYDSLVYEFVNE